MIRLLIQKRPRKLERMEKREVREGLGGYWGGSISTGPDDSPTSVRDGLCPGDLRARCRPALTPTGYSVGRETTAPIGPDLHAPPSPAAWHQRLPSQVRADNARLGSECDFAAFVARAHGSAVLAIPVDRIGMDQPWFSVTNLITGKSTVHTRSEVLNGLAFSPSPGDVVPIRLGVASSPIRR